MNTLWTDLFFVFGIGAGWIAVRLSIWMLEPGAYRHRLVCTTCSRPLPTYDFVPLLGSLRLAGRCPDCGGAVPLRTPCIELTMGVLWALSAKLYPNPIHALVWCVFWLYLLTAVGTDLLAMRVPNRLTRPAAVILWVLSVAAGIQGPIASTVGLISMWAIVFGLAFVTGGRGMGYGDVRVYGAVGAILGVGYGALSLVLAAVSASVVGLGLRAMGRLPKRAPIPFVPHIAIGCILAVFFGHQLIHWYLQVVFS